MKKTNIILRIDENTKQRWAVSASADNLALSEWIRRKCDFVYTPPKKVETVHTHQTPVDTTSAGIVYTKPVPENTGVTLSPTTVAPSKRAHHPRCTCAICKEPK